MSKFLADKVDDLKQQGVYRKLPILSSPNEATEVINGVEVINLCSNNYLGFANHSRLKQSAVDAIQKYGVGAGAVRTINGNTTLHEELDKKIAQFKHEEAAHHFQSGFNCNMGVISSILDPKDLILSDELNHASIIDGIRLSKAAKKVYPHCDMQHLEDILKSERKNYERVLLISDGVFSMDGDILPLLDWVNLAQKYDCITYVDDAHGSGVLGDRGRGTIDHFGLHGRVDIIVGTLSKALGGVGGYVAGSTSLYDWLNHRSRPILFSSALPPASVAAAIEAINLLEETNQYTEALWHNTKFFQSALTSLQFNIGATQTPITPVIVGDEAKALDVSKALLERQIYASPIVYPTVPLGKARIRFMISASHSKQQLEYVLDVLKDLRGFFV